MSGDGKAISIARSSRHRGPSDRKCPRRLQGAGAKGRGQTVNNLDDRGYRELLQVLVPEAFEQVREGSDGTDQRPETRGTCFSNDVRFVLSSRGDRRDPQGQPEARQSSVPRPIVHLPTASGSHPTSRVGPEGADASSCNGKPTPVTMRGGRPSPKCCISVPSTTRAAGTGSRGFGKGRNDRGDIRAVDNLLRGGRRTVHERQEPEQSKARGVSPESLANVSALDLHL